MIVRGIFLFFFSARCDNCVKTDANNHMWVMQMHDALSSHAVFRYYNYYRIECSGNAIDYSLAEFKFNYFICNLVNLL